MRNILTCVLLSVTLTTHGQESNALHEADRWGYPAIWLSTTAEPVSSMPLRFLFSTHPEKQFGYLLGPGWTCPMLESSVLQKSETSVHAYTIDGEKVTLRKLAGKENEYLSSNHEYSGAQDGKRFTLRRTNGEVHTFLSGRIHEFTNANHDQALWTLAGKRLESVTFKKWKGATSKLDLSYDKNGLLSRLDGNALPSPIEFRFSDVPQVTHSSLGLNVVSGLSKAVSSITVGKEALIDASYKLADDGTFLEMAGLKPTAHDPSILGEFQLGWEPVGGIIRFDKERNYTVTQATKTERPKIESQRRDNGLKEYYHYNPKTGIAELQINEEPALRRYYNMSPGKSRGLLRKIEAFDPKTGEWKATMQASYDRFGNLIRKMTEDDAEQVWHRNEDSATFFQDKKKVLTRSYFKDEKGWATEWEDGTRVKLAVQPDGAVNAEFEIEGKKQTIKLPSAMAQEVIREIKRRETLATEQSSASRK